MYHATFGGEDDLDTIDVADRPYAVSEADFAKHLSALLDHPYAVVGETAVQQLEEAAPSVLLTFDDGHVSNCRFVAPWLAERRLSGIFFITTDWTGVRPHYCGPADLRSMHSLGMAIGSHGTSHRFIADLSLTEARAELQDSKARLEDILGSEVTSFSFPGGRCTRRDVDLAFEVGYQAVHGSAFGVHRPGEHALVNRIPIRLDMSSSTLLELCEPGSLLYKRVALSTFLKFTAKRMLGNGVYDAIYRRFAA